MTAERTWAGPGTPYVLAILRIAYGLLWLQQVTWKVPPDFGLSSGGGLFYWTQEMVKYSFLPPHRFFVESVVLPSFLLFAWLTVLTEVSIGLSHVLGLLNRLGALLAVAMASNLLIGLIRHPGEWPWSYVMLLGYGLLFLSAHPGRVLGLDGPLARRLHARGLADRPWVRAVGLST